MDSTHFDQYIGLYKSTAKKYLSDMKHAVSDLRKNGSDPKALESIYIGAHNVKSQSLVMGLEDIGNFSHDVEKVIKQYMDTPKALNSEQLDVLDEIIDAIEEAVNVSENEKEADLAKEYEKLRIIQA